jgi:hypothetical protein
MADQFIAPPEGWTQERDRARHFASRWTTRSRRGVHSPTPAWMSPRPEPGLPSPCGNSVQVLQYDEVQFTKARAMLSGIGFGLGKMERGLADLRKKGLAYRS